ncbi:MAG TPA: hypothetical protein VNO79_14485 [Actinomycetota bacterium]|nr:hypothetical protein [Actinomycetota bacterium]
MSQHRCGCACHCRAPLEDWRVERMQVQREGALPVREPVPVTVCGRCAGEIDALATLPFLELLVRSTAGSWWRAA